MDIKYSGFENKAEGRVSLDRWRVPWLKLAGIGRFAEFITRNLKNNDGVKYA